MSEPEPAAITCMTIEVERHDGEPIDTDALSALLAAHGYKLDGWCLGKHLIARSALIRAREDVELALAVVLGRSGGSNG